jgi:iron complex outermembrane receptor protein
VLQYQVPDVVNVYGTYSKGFKSGQFNVSSLSGTPVQPETVNAFEVGVKTLFPGNWRATAAVYYYDYKDIQVSARAEGAAIVELTNAASAKIKGAELTFEGKLLPSLTASLGLSYTDANDTDFPNASITIPRTTIDPVPATACIEGTGPRVGGNRGLICDVSGNRMIRTPEWTANAALTYEHPLFGGTLDASANVFISDSFYWDWANRLKEPSYTVVNADIGWTTADGRYRVGVWGENLTDELYSLVLSTSALADWVNYAKPRSYGVNLKYSF